jgi:hypothetical protein
MGVARLDAKGCGSNGTLEPAAVCTNPLHLVCNTYVNAVRALCGRTAIQLGYTHLFGSPNAPLATAASLTVVV